jgi:hypothetical protein
VKSISNKIKSKKAIKANPALSLTKSLMRSEKKVCQNRGKICLFCLFWLYVFIIDLIV